MCFNRLVVNVNKKVTATKWFCLCHNDWPVINRLWPSIAFFTTSPSSIFYFYLQSMDILTLPCNIRLVMNSKQPFYTWLFFFFFFAAKCHINILIFNFQNVMDLLQAPVVIQIVWPHITSNALLPVRNVKKPSPTTTWFLPELVQLSRR